jgi:hypothetical protein
MMVRRALRSLCFCNTLAGTSERSFIKEGCRQWLQFEKNDLCGAVCCSAALASL